MGNFNQTLLHNASSEIKIRDWETMGLNGTLTSTSDDNLDDQSTPQMITLQLDVVYCIAAAILWPVLTGVIMWCFNPTKHMFKKATDMEVESTEIACQTDHDKDYVHHV